MAKIRIDLVEQLVDGHSVTFKAPCDCTAIDGLKVYYPTENGVTSDVFTLNDAHGNILTGLGNLFAKGAYVKVVLDTVNKAAYIQNANTNSYIEARLVDIRSTTENVIKDGMAGDLRVKKMAGNTEQKTGGSNKNILPSIGLTTQTINGVTFTPTYGNVGELLYITASGTATADAVYKIGEMLGIAGQWYYFCGNPSEIPSKAYGIAYRAVSVGSDKGYDDFDYSVIDNSNSAGYPVSWDSSKNWNVEVSILITNGITVSDMKFYPMVCNKDVTDFTYEPYTAGVYPNPVFPQPMYHTSDVVEMMQGSYNISNGVYVYVEQSVCCKNHIPCKPNDVIKIDMENAVYPRVIFYSGNTFVSVQSSGSNKLNTYSVTVPSGVDNFTFYINEPNGLLIDTVGKITLTINGKYVNCIREHGKNFLDLSGFKQVTKDGITCTPIRKANGELDYVNVNGTASALTYIALSTFVFDDDFIVSGCPSGGSYETYFMNVSSHSNDYGNGTRVNKDGTLHTVQIGISSGYTANNLKFYPMIRRADITDDTYEPYQETVAYFLTDEPLRRVGNVCDTVENRNGKFGVLRKIKEYTFLGTESIGVSSTTKNGLYRFSTFMFTDIVNTRGLSKAISDRFSPVGIEDWSTEGIIVDGLGGNNDAIGFFVNGERASTVEEFKSWLAENPTTIDYILATPIWEELDTESQLALRSLETFDGVTYIEVDSRVKPSEIEVEYGATEIGAEVLDLSNRIQYVDVDITGSKTAYQIYPPKGFTNKNSVIIAFDHITDGGILHNAVIGTDTSDSTTFRSQAWFQKNESYDHFVFWPAQLGHTQYSFEGTLRVYFQRIF